MTVDPDSRLQLLRSQRESAFGAWLEANVRLSSALDRLRQLRAAKREALRAKGISLRQLGEFRHWDEEKSKPVDNRTIARYARCRMVIHAIDQKWDAPIATAQVEVDQASTDLAVATADLLSTMPVALASELTGLSLGRLSAIARTSQNKHCAPTTRAAQRS
jgi:hypothetical protein